MSAETELTTELSTAEIIPEAAVQAREPEPVPPQDTGEFRRFAMLVGAGWLFTNIGYSIADLPHKLLLKNQLHLGQEAVAVYFALAHFTNYIKPLAGIFTDAIPLFGTRRRHYLLLSLLACGLGWLLLGVVPRTRDSLFTTYALMYVTVVFISTTLGGVMAEGGERFHASGRLSAQRIGIFRIATLVGAPVGGWLATLPFALTTTLTASLHFALIPFFWLRLREYPTARRENTTLQNVKEQAGNLVRSKALWAAAGMIFLVEIAPGFNTPLLFYQKDVLRFQDTFIGTLGFVTGAAGVAGALAFSFVCRRFSLRPLLAGGIILHSLVALLYLWYRTPTSALIITALYSAANTLATLPLYDLAIRGTPRGCEALGYAVMMSVFNIVTAVADVLGSRLVGQQTVSFNGLIWLNAATTALVLFAVPFLPRALMDRKDGEACPTPQT